MGDPLPGRQQELRAWQPPLPDPESMTCQCVENSVNVWGFGQFNLQKAEGSPFPQQSFPFLNAGWLQGWGSCRTHRPAEVGDDVGADPEGERGAGVRGRRDDADRRRLFGVGYVPTERQRVWSYTKK